MRATTSHRGVSVLKEGLPGSGKAKKAPAFQSSRISSVKRLRIFISNHLTYFLARPKAMKVLSHEDDVLKGALGSEIRALKRQYYHCCADLVEELKLAKKLRFNSRAVVLCLFGMMNWIHTWYNRRVDGDADTVARAIGDVFLRGVYGGTRLPNAGPC